MSVGSIQVGMRMERVVAGRGPDVHLHTLRHSYATHLLEEASLSGNSRVILVTSPWTRRSTTRADGDERSKGPHTVAELLQPIVDRLNYGREALTSEPPEASRPKASGRNSRREKNPRNAERRACPRLDVSMRSEQSSPVPFAADVLF
jgi:hypothetical protein